MTTQPLSHSRALPRAAMIALLTILSACGGTQTTDPVSDASDGSAGNTATRIAAAMDQAADGFDRTVGPLTTDLSFDQGPCQPAAVVTELQLVDIPSLAAASSQITLTSGDRRGALEILVFSDSVQAEDVAKAYDYMVGSRRGCLIDLEMIQGGLGLGTEVDGEEYATTDVTGTLASFTAELSNLRGAVAFIDVAVVAAGNAVVLIHFGSDNSPIDPAIIAELAEAVADAA